MAGSLIIVVTSAAVPSPGRGQHGLTGPTGRGNLNRAFRSGPYRDRYGARVAGGDAAGDGTRVVGRDAAVHRPSDLALLREHVFLLSLLDLAGLHDLPLEGIRSLCPNGLARREESESLCDGGGSCPCGRWVMCARVPPMRPRSCAGHRLLPRGLYLEVERAEKPADPRLPGGRVDARLAEQRRARGRAPAERGRAHGPAGLGAPGSAVPGNRLPRPTQRMSKCGSARRPRLP
jgi:hypothetical protein